MKSTASTTLGWNENAQWMWICSHLFRKTIFEGTTLNYFAIRCCDTCCHWTHLFLSSFIKHAQFQNTQNCNLHYKCIIPFSSRKDQKYKILSHTTRASSCPRIGVVLSSIPIIPCNTTSLILSGFVKCLNPIRRVYFNCFYKEIVFIKQQMSKRYSTLYVYSYNVLKNLIIDEISFTTKVYEHCMVYWD